MAPVITKEATLLTYDVRIWGIRSRNSKKAPFQLRWMVGGVPHQQPFLTKTLADGRRSQLMSAVRDGEQFDTATGLPVSELRLLNSPTWYQHACEYALMKWPKAAAKHRVGIAEALTNITPVFVSSSTSKPDPAVLRLALRSWAFQMVRTDDGEYKARKDAEAPPADVVEALEWVAKHSIKVTDVADSLRLRLALAALSRKLDGRPAADNTFRRKRTVLSNALRYAVERGLLPANPLPSVDWDPRRRTTKSTSSSSLDRTRCAGCWTRSACKACAGNTCTPSSPACTTPPCGRRRWRP